MATPTSCRKHSLVIPVSAQNKHRNFRQSRATLTIAHRGASYQFPEDSLQAYRFALELGADFIEPDLVVSSDGLLLAMHSVDLNETTTNLDLEFGATHRPAFSHAANRTGYWSYNFTWDEIQRLRLKQRLPTTGSYLYDGMFSITSLSQIVDMLHHWNTVDLPATLQRNNSAVWSDSSAAPSVSISSRRPSPLQKIQSGLYVEFKSLE